MIDAPVLLKSLQRLEKDLEDDLRTRVTPDAATSPQEQEVASDLDAKLRAQYREARDAGRTGQAFEVWRDEFLTQVAVAWILGCVFVRFMEDNGLVETPRLSGPGERRQRALDQHELYFKDPERRTHSDREYLLDVFEQTQKLPAARELFDAKHNPLWAVGLSGDGATKLLQFWQHVDTETGALDHDFTDPDWNTRFLGDLYQDLSIDAQKKYALLQTPEFVEEFILDRTLTPAIEEFGFREVRLIDPTCGSGHFLLGAFHRLFDLWVKHEPGANSRELVQRALDQVYGVDLNPFAVAIARFRLLVEALGACDAMLLADAPGFHLNLATGDSLLHGKLFRGVAGVQQELNPEDDPLQHVYQVEDADALARILGQQYHAVVGNPPYITVKDKPLSTAYRKKYDSCHRQYSLAVPFIERFFDLALRSHSTRGAGAVGIISANSFMKREFGRRLVEIHLVRLDLTHIIDTSHAYIPGHGTPTVILFGRNRAPVSKAVRAVLGIKDEEGTPENPEQGAVWSSIVELCDSVGSATEYISVADLERDRLATHPWVLGGGGAAELKEELDASSKRRLGEVVDPPIGRGVRIGADEAFLVKSDQIERRRWPVGEFRPFLKGEDVRDWSANPGQSVWYPYGEVSPATSFLKDRWPLRNVLKARSTFQGVMADAGLRWFDYMQHTGSAYETPLSLVFSNVTTHNHFALDRGGSVFSSHSPVVKMPKGSSEEVYLALLGVLNSSVACFWMKQVFQPKSHSTQRHHPDPARTAFEFTSTGMMSFPIPDKYPDARVSELVAAIDSQAGEHRRLLSTPPLIDTEGASAGDIAKALSERWVAADLAREVMIGLQEELDWIAYRAYGLTGEMDLEAAELAVSEFRCPRGERPFEQVHGRRSLVRRGGAPLALSETEVSSVGDLPDCLQPIWKRRRELLARNPQVAAIEQMEFKRLWRDTEDNIPEAEFRRRHDRSQLEHWMLGRIEGVFSSSEGGAKRLLSTVEIAAALAADDQFLSVAEAHRNRPDFDVASLVEELVREEAVPAISGHRYSLTGREKLQVWERTWTSQRAEDFEHDIDELAQTRVAEAGTRGEAVPTPPKFGAKDYSDSAGWRLRGKLDVPRERFASFPGCEAGPDSSLLLGWAGWSHLELAHSIASFLMEMREQQGWQVGRLTPLLAGLLELIPWVKQWHNEIDAEYGVRMGDYFEDFVNEEARALSLTIEQIESWTPPKKTRTAKPRKKAARKKKTETEAKPA